MPDPVSATMPQIELIIQGQVIKSGELPQPKESNSPNVWYYLLDWKEVFDESEGIQHYCARVWVSLIELLM